MGNQQYTSDGNVVGGTASQPVESSANLNPFGGKSLEFTGGDDPNAKTVRLRDRLNEADTERRKAEEEALARERAAEIRREERLKKIAYMQDMPDSTPAGTGEYLLLISCEQLLCRISRLILFCFALLLFFSS